MPNLTTFREWLDLISRLNGTTFFQASTCRRPDRHRANRGFSRDPCRQCAYLWFRLYLEASAYALQIRLESPSDPDADLVGEAERVLDIMMEGFMIYHSEMFADDDGVVAERSIAILDLAQLAGEGVVNPSDFEWVFDE